MKDGLEPSCHSLVLGTESDGLWRHPIWRWRCGECVCQATIHHHQSNPFLPWRCLRNRNRTKVNPKETNGPSHSIFKVFLNIADSHPSSPLSHTTSPVCTHAVIHPDQVMISYCASPCASLCLPIFVLRTIARLRFWRYPLVYNPLGAPYYPESHGPLLTDTVIHDLTHLRLQTWLPSKPILNFTFQKYWNVTFHVCLCTCTLFFLEVHSFLFSFWRLPSRTSPGILPHLPPLPSLTSLP